MMLPRKEVGSNTDQEQHRDESGGAQDGDTVLELEPQSEILRAAQLKADIASRGVAAPSRDSRLSGTERVA